MARAARTAVGSPSTANHASLRLGGSPATNVIIGCALPVWTPRSARAASTWLLKAPLACKMTGGSSCARGEACCATSSMAASGTASHSSVAPEAWHSPGADRSANGARQCAGLPPRAGRGARNDLRDGEALRMEQLCKAAGKRSGADEGNGFHLVHDSRVARRSVQLCIVSS